MSETLFGPWRKSSYSGDEGNCVEVASIGAIRDSKNPVGPTLRVDLPGLIAQVKHREWLRAL